MSLNRNLFLIQNNLNSFLLTFTLFTRPSAVDAFFSSILYSIKTTRFARYFASVHDFDFRCGGAIQIWPLIIASSSIEWFCQIIAIQWTVWPDFCYRFLVKIKVSLIIREGCKEMLGWMVANWKSVTALIFSDNEYYERDKKEKLYQTWSY